MTEHHIQSNINRTFQTSAELAYTIISQKILNGEFESGMKLSRRKMAEVTGVSVIPVIEALKKLEEDNLVESKPQWGSFVSTPTLEKVIEAYQFREAVECQCARIVSQKITVEQRASINEIAKVLDNTAYTPETTEKMNDTHFLFHTTLAQYTDNALLIDSLRRINLFWILCKALHVKRPQVPTPRYWHMQLIDVIAEGDADKAEQMMRIHIMDSLDPIISNAKIAF